MRKYPKEEQEIKTNRMYFHLAYYQLLNCKRWHRVLGVPADAADELFIFAYQRQIEQDEHQIPWYLSCLQYLATQRNSETLSTQVATEKSAGRYDTFELQDAYRYLGFDISNQIPDEDHVIGTFISRLENTAPQQQTELRRSLQIIGEHMNSSKILAVASDSMFRFVKHLQ